ncbi:UDP-2,3-diacylglucosamine diphosphatase [Gracilimonas mengyeensis]|uniref:UDP-2,3-diacylglucosamine pyrophosphatase LpxH n=1 Tax=Gracilimonas mengyeensis TaxID=1302730 RepID=A0A521F7Y0_9BACT|nr:UDP-2,3-diacylglucosamine diphosphatase [Gracilimonas mengyeensis]SMO91711.1 UDP-2,3-diacylglucosamine pyrophosphatase LpxH [Gracilimonas mengyeensis]
MKRTIDTVVLSDVHLGTVGCHAVELVQYLNSINPKRVILNGDFIDMWNFRKYYWPEAHMHVIRTLITMMTNGTDIYYLTGNHDEILRKVSSLQLGPLFIRDKLVLELNGEQVWFFHGDIFDITMKHSKWIAKLGGKGYELLILLNRWMNYLSMQFGYGKFSLSKKIKYSVKQAVNFIDDFEVTAMELAIEEGYDYVVCGHIHQPKIRGYENDSGSVIYLNSGDWVENLTALEFDGNEWSLYRYQDDVLLQNNHRLKLLMKSHTHGHRVMIG